VQQERTLVETGLHSRHRAMEELGVEDPQGELERIRDEQGLALDPHPISVSGNGDRRSS
jgi:hypothetical protein